MKTYNSISHESDAQYAAGTSKTLAKSMGFKKTQYVSISVAVSELASNIRKYAQNGSIIIEPVYQGDKCGIQVIAEDFGPGIADIALALKEGYSTNGTLGLGLSGVNRMMDHFEIETQRRRGVKISIIKWL